MCDLGAVCDLRLILTVDAPSASSLGVWDQPSGSTHSTLQQAFLDQYKLHEGSYTGNASEPLWLGGENIVQNHVRLGLKS